MSTPADFLRAVEARHTPTRSECVAAAEALHAASLPPLSLAEIFDAKAAWSLATFGPEQRVAGVIKHIRKELVEIEAKPTDLEEWVDVVMIAMDGAWRCAGADGAAFARALVAKHEKNLTRDWPDWRMASPDEPIEHVRTLDEKLAACVEFAKAPPPADELRPAREASERALIAQVNAEAEAKRWAERVRLLEARIARARTELGT